MQNVDDVIVDLSNSSYGLEKLIPKLPDTEMSRKLKAGLHAIVRLNIHMIENAGDIERQLMEHEE